MDARLRAAERACSIKLDEFLRLDRLLETRQMSYFWRRGHMRRVPDWALRQTLAGLNQPRPSGCPPIERREFRNTLRGFARDCVARRRELAAFIRALRTDEAVATFAKELRRAGWVAGPVLNVGGHASGGAPARMAIHPRNAVGAVARWGRAPLPAASRWLGPAFALGLLLLAVVLGPRDGSTRGAPQEVSVASAIDCDCASVDPGIFGPRWIAACQSAEQWLHELAAKNEFEVLKDDKGRLGGSHHCHLAIHGPAAWPVFQGPLRPPGFDKG